MCGAVTYEVFVVGTLESPRESGSSKSSLGSKSGVAGNQNATWVWLETARLQVLESVAPILEQHAFTFEPFWLEVDLKDRCLKGSTQVCNSMDEAFIAFVLREITRLFPGACLATMRDRFGETLPIQAAEALPRWVEEDTIPGRAYLFRGMLHIVSPKCMPFGSKWQACREAVLDDSKPTQAGERVESELEREGFGVSGPKHYQQPHRFAIAMSETVARIATASPMLLILAAHALRHADVTDLRTRRREINRFEPSSKVFLKQIKLSVDGYSTLGQYETMFQDQVNAFAPEWDEASCKGVSQSRRQQALFRGFVLAKGLELLQTKLSTKSSTKNLIPRPCEPLSELNLNADEPLSRYTSSLICDQETVQRFFQDAITGNLPLKIPSTPPPEDDADVMRTPAAGPSSMLGQVSESMLKFIGKPEESTIEDAEALIKEVESFFKTESGFEGVDALSSDSEDSDGEDEDEDEDEVSNRKEEMSEPFNFNVGELLNVLKGLETARDATLPSEDAENSSGSVGSLLEEDEDEDHLLDEVADELLEAELSAEKNLTSTFGGEGLRPMDVDMNLVENLVASLVSEGSTAGPTSSFVAHLDKSFKQ